MKKEDLVRYLLKTVSIWEKSGKIKWKGEVIGVSESAITIKTVHDEMVTLDIDNIQSVIESINIKKSTDYFLSDQHTGHTR